jgi:alkylation response protein AidB-like acyl-CoA dehydrogenase
VYDLSEEHKLLRQTVREIAEAKIAPFAAAVDAEARFPQEALDALTGAGMHAVHIPEAYGGEGADALAAVRLGDVHGVHPGAGQRVERLLREPGFRVDRGCERGDLRLGDVADRLAQHLVLF